MFSISLIEDEIGFKKLCNEWNELLADSTINSIFLTYEWLFTWWRCFKNDRRLLIIIVRKNGMLIGIAPLMVKNKVVEFIGTPSNDEADFIVHKDFTRDATYSFIKFLIKDCTFWGIINLKEIPSDSLTIELLSETARRENLHYSGWVRSISPFIKTDGSWDGFLKSKGSKFRNNIKRNERLAEDMGQISYETFGGDSIADSIIKRLFDVERCSWKEKGGAPLFDNDKNREFFINIKRIFSSKGWIVVHILKLNDRDIAFQLCFDYDDKILEYTTAYDKEYSTISPGSIILKNIIKDTFDRKKREYDFLRGDEGYKKRWADESRNMWQVVISRKGVYTALNFYFNIKLRGVLNKSPILVALYDVLANRWERLKSFINIGNIIRGQGEGGFNQIDISFIMPLNSGNTVLFIGKNTYIAEALSEICKKVLIVNKNFICKPQEIPIKRESIDLIIIEDIKNLFNKSAISSQLSDLKALLRNGGYIYLFVFNKWNGGYSYNSYNKSLIRNGFKEIENYIAIPNHNNPKFILNANDKSAMKYYLSCHFERDSIYKNILFICIKLFSNIGLIKYIVPSYIISARRE
ncbi:MAG: GNAT family N-acetyltransferase [Nitrospinae bacterium]|nr:GNAT family N-acetyltransferase [Nitrospinota bacterium]